MPITSHGKCYYTCTNGEWLCTGGNPAPGYYCPLPMISGPCEEEMVFVQNAEPIPTLAAPLAANMGEYFFNPATKLVHFRRGTCDKGKVFKETYSVKELAEVDSTTAELVKTLQKNKKVSTFHVLIKAQKQGKKSTK